MSNPPAGWYPDPTGKADTIRWWDGTQWTTRTETTSAAGATDQPAAPESTAAEPTAEPTEQVAADARTQPVATTQPVAQEQPVPQTQPVEQGQAVPETPVEQGQAVAETQPVEQQPAADTQPMRAEPAEAPADETTVAPVAEETGPTHEQADPAEQLPTWDQDEVTTTPPWAADQATGPTPSWEKGQATGPTPSWEQGPVQQTARGWSTAPATQQGWSQTVQPPQRRPEPEPKRSRRIPLPFIVAGGVVLLLLVATGIFFVARGGGDPQAQGTPSPAGATDSPSPATSDSPTASVSESTAPTPRFTPGQSRNPALHQGNRSASDAISFPRQPPAKWSDRKRFSRAVIDSSGQYSVLQAKFDGKNDWYSNIFVGRLNTSILYNGHPKATASDVALELRNGFYQPIPITSRPTSSRPVTVAGHKGWLIRQVISARSKTPRSPNLYLTVAVFDLGDGTAVVYVSDVPANRPDLRANEAAAFRGLHIG